MPGTIQKLSAVVVDYVLMTMASGLRLTGTRRSNYSAVRRSFSADRGDSVQVINSPFVAPAPVEPMPEPGLMEQAWVWELGRGALAAIAVLAPIFAVLRPMTDIQRIAARARRALTLRGSHGRSGRRQRDAVLVSPGRCTRATACRPPEPQLFAHCMGVRALKVNRAAA